MKKITAWAITTAGIIGVFYSIYGYISTSGVDGINLAVATMFLGIIFLASLALINLGIVILRDKLNNSVYGVISVASVIVLVGIPLAVVIWATLKG